LPLPPEAQNNALLAAFNKYDLVRVVPDLWQVGLAHRRRAIRAALNGGKGWDSGWDRAVAYHYWSRRVSLAEQHAYYDKDYRKGNTYMGLGSDYALFRLLSATVRTVAECFVLGWLDWARDLVERVYWPARIEGWPQIWRWAEDSSVPEPCRAKYFVLRLVQEQQGWPKCEPPPWAEAEPLFVALLKEWNAPDPQRLAPILLGVCDRHTRPGESNDLLDVEDFYFPFEVLTLLKLRELHGLQNLEIDHLVMDTPLGKLRPSPPLYTDPLLEGVLKRAMSENPAL